MASASLVHRVKAARSLSDPEPSQQFMLHHIRACVERRRRVWVMCNNYRLTVDAATIIEAFAQLKITIRFPEGIPNIAARNDIKITDVAPIVRGGDDKPGAAELVQRRWSW